MQLKICNYGEKMKPRLVPSVDEYYICLALWISVRSKDNHTQCGAIIVGDGNIPLGIGFNGSPRCIDDNLIDWSRPNKYGYVIHAESNAIYHSNGKLDGSTIYVSGPPCSKCMLNISACGIKRVVYLKRKYDSNSMLSNQDDWKLALEIARLSNIKLDEFSGDLNWMEEKMLLFKETI